jgi:hypothetical protein
VTSHLNGGIVETEETAVARQRRDRHLSAATDTHTTLEKLLEAMFSVWYVPRLYRESR